MKTFTGHKKLVAGKEIKLRVNYNHEDLFVKIWCVFVCVLVYKRSHSSCLSKII